MRKTMMFAFFSIWFAVVATEASAGCNGNACNDVDVFFENGCYKIQNYSNRTVKVSLGPTTYTVRRGKTITANNPFGGRCIKGFIGGTKAVYK